ncbi:hypothetical protein OGAPHI_002244 [Ogataea philodendri]|uniref:Uncharacterized protein n=1 Tax=Ogataea philodendri TaxID=1378263 RepID=A0A9P8PB38_9ASCO|nr:uncharacterized protein OGAPHI_002244 [Ogataea philodendri]KAH3668490.1 hypothetical protein OGAPHI_002244 [Ogataea philodendri]
MSGFTIVLPNTSFNPPSPKDECLWCSLADCSNGCASLTAFKIGSCTFWDRIFNLLASSSVIFTLSFSLDD